jgi:drug/metabolite transporter (DMT)-like permease
MKGIFLALMGLVLYAVMAVIIDLKLRNFNTFAVLAGAYCVMLPLAVVGMLVMRSVQQTLIMPTGSMIWLFLLLGLIYFFADASYFGAYSAGASLMVITTAIVLVPVLASLAKYILAGGTPNIWQVAGYITAAVSLILIVRGGLAN